MNLKKIAASIAALGAVTFAHAANVACKSSKDHSKPRNEADTSLKSPV